MHSIALDMRADADHAIVWRNQRLYLLDQRVLPREEKYLELRSAKQTAAAIHDMVVRGAPAIGISAAYGTVLAAQRCYTRSPGDWKQHIEADLALLAAARPTAVNLCWALQRMRALIELQPAGDPVASLLAEARAIHQEDVAANRAMGELGAALIDKRTSVITHCNAGALATGGYGTALGVIRSAHAAGRIEQVYADETRPWLQGTRLTAWELARDGIPVALLVDGAAASRMSQGGIDWIIVGSDRIAANGDVANKIGTYGLAVAARYHGVRVMVVAPTSTIDMSTASGADIPIETRDPAELLNWEGSALSAPGVEAWNPVFDVTPAALVDAIVTERGVALRPDVKKIEYLMAQSPERL